MILVLAAVLLAQLHGVISGGVYISPSGSFRVQLPHLLEQGRRIYDEFPDTNVLMVSMSDDLCREFIVTERPGELADDSLRAWVDQQVIPKLRGIGADVRAVRMANMRNGPAVYLHYHHPRASACTRRNDTTKADADVGVYIYHTGSRFYRVLYVLGELPELGDTVLGLARGPVDTLLKRFADGFAISQWVTRPSRHPQFAALSLANAFSCGLSTDSIAYCWGAARGPATYTHSPAPLPTALKFAQLAAGEDFSCGIVAGDLYCWGFNFLGVLGIGSDSAVWGWNPAPVIGGLKFASVSVGTYHVCGLTISGAAYCWGDNEHGELGTGDTIHRAAPALVEGELRFKMLSVGFWFTCGLTTEGAAYCWGNANDGELGAPATQMCKVSENWQRPCSTKPLAVTGGLTFSSLDAGTAFACGLTTGGTAFCWGDNQQYELGAGPKTRKLAKSTTPLPVAGDLHYTSLGAGDSHACALTAEGRVYCWGANRDSQLGVRSPEASLVPVAVSGGLQFRVLAVGSAHSCGIASDDATYCWGQNFNSALGNAAHFHSKDGLRSASPVKVDGAL